MIEDWKKLEGRFFKTDVNSTTEEAMAAEDAAVIHYTTDGDIVFNGVKFCQVPTASIDLEAESSQFKGGVITEDMLEILSLSTTAMFGLLPNGKDVSDLMLSGKHPITILFDGESVKKDSSGNIIGIYGTPLNLIGSNTQLTGKEKFLLNVDGEEGESNTGLTIKLADFSNEKYTAYYPSLASVKDFYYAAGQVVVDGESINYVMPALKESNSIQEYAAGCVVAIYHDFIFANWGYNNKQNNGLAGNCYKFNWSKDDLSGIKMNVATSSDFGCVKIGDGITINSTESSVDFGKISVTSATKTSIGGVKQATLDLQSEYEFLKTAPTVTDIDEAKVAINHLRLICKTLIDKLEEAGTLTH